MFYMKCSISDRYVVTELAMIAIERYIAIIHIDTTAVVGESTTFVMDS